MPQTKKIGVNLDDVLLAVIAGLFPWHNRLYGTNNSENDVRPFELSSTWGCSIEATTSRVLAFYETTEHAECAPVPGAVDAMTALSQNHELVIVTSKPANLETMTHAWVEKHFPNIMNVKFTAEMEKKLDEVEAGKVK